MNPIFSSHLSTHDHSSFNYPPNNPYLISDFKANPRHHIIPYNYFSTCLYKEGFFFFSLNVTIILLKQLLFTGHLSGSFG